MTKEMFKKDLYSLLGIEDSASEKAIVKAYRKRALKCHPDKNPDNPKAAEQFHELSRALEILTDPAAKAAYDQSRKAKKAVDERNKVLDSKRKKFKEDLEAREQAVFDQSRKVDAAEAERKLQQEIERLRKEGSRLLEQEQERLKEELKKAAPGGDKDGKEQDLHGELPRIKLKWQAKKGDPDNGGYNFHNLSDILSCYGHVSALLISTKRNGSAIVEFSSPAVSADILDEAGLQANCFTMTWLSGKPSKSDEPYLPTETSNGHFHFDSGRSGESSVNFGTANGASSSGVFPVHNHHSVGVNTSEQSDGNKDFESLVLWKMRQAEERKRLIEQMMKDDGTDT